MKLSHALGLAGDETVAFISTGGKSCAIFTLAKELKQATVISMRTQIEVSQTAYCDDHKIISSIEEVDDLELTPGESLLLTGPLISNNLFSGLDLTVLKKIQQFCKIRGSLFFIKVEEDKLPFSKGQAKLKPEIISWVDTIVVVAGMNRLWINLNADPEQHPEYFAKLAQMETGDNILLHQMIKALDSLSGKLKEINKSTRRILFLSQVDDELIAGKAAWLASKLEKVYDRVLIGSLQGQDREEPVSSVHSHTAAVILAAGRSERLGQPKQLLSWNDEPYIKNIAQTALVAGLNPVIVITGAEKELIENALNSLPVKCVFNPEWSLGQATSVRAGVTNLPQGCDRVMFFLSDQPQISIPLIRQLIERHNLNRAPITIPLTPARRGNPVLFGNETFTFLKTLQGDQGGRSAFNAFSVDELMWIDERILLDVDKQEDIEKLNVQYFPTMPKE